MRQHHQGYHREIASQHGLVYDRLLRAALRRGKGAGMAPARQQAALAYTGMPGDVSAGSGEKDALSIPWTTGKAGKRSLRRWRSWGPHAGLRTKLPLPFPVAGAVRFRRQAQFDPLRFAAAAARAARPC